MLPSVVFARVVVGGLVVVVVGMVVGSVDMIFVAAFVVEGFVLVVGMRVGGLVVVTFIVFGMVDVLVFVVVDDGIVVGVGSVKLDESIVFALKPRMKQMN